MRVSVPRVIVLPAPERALATEPVPVIANVSPPAVLVNVLISELLTVVVEL